MESDALTGRCRYAAFGSNLHPLRLQRRIPSARPLGVVRVDGFRLAFNKTSDVDGSGKANIVDGDACVFFAVYEMAAGDKATLDLIEGLGQGYDEREVDCGAFGSCKTYQACPSVIDDRLSPMDWYKEIVLLGALYHRLPEDYVAAIARVTAVADPDEERNRVHASLLRDLRRAGRSGGNGPDTA